jgi:hypothetical protein
VSGTAKTVLIVGGVAVGAYVILKALAPARPSSPSYSLFGGSSSSTAAGVTQGVIQGFANIFSSSSSKSPSGYDQNPGAVIQGDRAGIASYDAQGSSSAPVYGIAGIDY